MTKEETNRLKLIETELAYLRKAIEELKKMRTVEIHYHYTNDYSGLAQIIEGLSYKDPEM